MTVRVGGVPEGAVVLIQVLRDCDRDGEPESDGIGGCRSPVYERESRPASRENVIEDELDFGQLEAEGTPLPTGEVLWLRASRLGSRQARQVMFGIVDDPCNLWESLIDSFLGGRCNANLRQALVQHR